jgi:hypothetical protein
MVQMIPAAPMEAPIAIRMIIVLRCNLVTLPDEVEAVDDGEGVVELVIVVALGPAWIRESTVGVLDGVNVGGGEAEEDVGGSEEETEAVEIEEELTTVAFTGCPPPKMELKLMGTNAGCEAEVA